MRITLLQSNIPVTLFRVYAIVAETVKKFKVRQRKWFETGIFLFPFPLNFLADALEKSIDFFCLSFL